MATALTIDEQINHFLVQLSPKQKKAVLGVIKIFAEEKENAAAWSDDDYSAEMNKRFTEYESGSLKTYTLEKTEANARRVYKRK